MFRLLLAVSCVFACAALAPPQTQPLRVGIIGSGISGSSTAFFLRELFAQQGRQLEITLFEKNAVVGGRMKSATVAGIKAEVGASIYLESNYYLKAFADLLGLHSVPHSPPTDKLGIWSSDAGDFAFLESDWQLVTLAKMMLRFGPIRFYQLRQLVQTTVDKWYRLYELQNQGVAFESVEEFLKHLDLYQLTQETFFETLNATGTGLEHSALIKELAYGITLVNYNQNTMHMNGLASLISLAPLLAGSAILTADEGNYKICEGLIEKAGATLHLNRNVVNLTYGKVFASSGRELGYRIKSVDTVHKVVADDEFFDVVVIAAPLEFTNFEFSEGDAPGIAPKLPPFMRREYQEVWTTVVEGSLQPTFFNQKPDSQLPDAVIFAQGEVSPPFTSLSTLHTFANGYKLFKTFSTSELGRETMDFMLKKRSHTDKVRWRAYPVFNPPEKFAPTQLLPGLYYVNSVENAASAMEVMSVWARNIAMLVARREGLDVTKPSRFGPVGKSEL